mgnify:FL=1
MQIKSDYFIASFMSFLIHAFLILYLMGFFYSEKTFRPILSTPINVNLVFKEEVEKNSFKNASSITKEVKVQKIAQSQIEKKIQFTPQIKATKISSLIKEDQIISEKSEQNQINEFSNLMIKFIQSAWIKPQNIQDGLICDLRMTINKNGRIINIDLIKSSGNIRFDNSAINAVKRVETFNFFNKIPYTLYQNNFKNIVITFNPI